MIRLVLFCHLKVKLSKLNDQRGIIAFDENQKQNKEVD